LGITSTGVAYAWGLDTSTQLGIGAIFERLTPVQVCQSF
jgi:hypothetical protein